MKQTISAAFAMILLAACGQTSTPAPAQSVAASAKPTATPLAVLAQQYVALVAPSNTALDNLNAALGPNATMSSAMPSFKAYLATLTTFSDQLPAFAAELPASDQADIQQLRQEIAKEVSDLTSIVADTTNGQFNIDVLQWSSDVRGFGAAANLVRADLGLPPAH
jgi:hypothetical protein